MRLLLIILFIPLFAFAQGFENCKEEWTEESPFKLTDVTQNKTDVFKFGEKSVNFVNVDSKRVLTEKFFVSNQPNLIQNYNVIKRGSIVKALTPFDKETNELVKVKVISTGALPQYDNILDTKLVKKDQIGYLPTASIRPSDKNDFFILKEDAKFFSFGSKGAQEVILGKNQVLRPVYADGKYKIFHCNNGETELLFYAYEVATSKDPEQDEILVNEENCATLNPILDKQFYNLQVLSQKIAQTYLAKKEKTFNQIEVNEWGNVRLLTKDELDSKVGAEDTSKFNIVHYQGDDPQGSDTWIQPGSYCALMRLSTAWKEKCPDKKCTIQIGDISYRTPAKDQRGTDPLGHKSHANATCADIRPFRIDDKMQGLNLTQASASAYDRETMRSFVKLLIDESYESIYFNDEVLQKEFGSPPPKNSCGKGGEGLLLCPGHDNHLHFCFPSNSTCD